MGADALPRVFGPFTLLHLLAEGGMGQVFLARARGGAGIDRLCVVKTLRDRHARDAEYARRFLDEARLVVQLGHRNVCSIFQVGSVDDTLFIAMEHVLGRDLAVVLDRAAVRGRPLSLSLALTVVREVLEALDYAHRLTHAETGAPLQLVHRDLAPTNVMISLEGEVKLIDFGLAASTLKTERTGAGQVFGRLAYLSPEQAKSEPVDARADQYAAAVLAYEAVTGVRYFAGLEQDAIWGTLGKPFTPSKWSSLPPKLQPILAKALSPRREDRFPTCGALLRELERFMVDEKMMASAAELRALMHELFPADQEAFRRLLASTGSAAAQLPSDGAIDAHTPGTAPPTERIRRGGSSTLRLPERLPPRGIVVAAGALGLVAIGLVIALAARPDPTAAPDAGDGATATAPAADAGSAAEVLSALADDAGMPDDPAIELASPPVQPLTARRPPPVTALSLPQKLKALKACEGRQQCAAALLATDGAARGPDETRVFLLEVDRCVAKCRR